MRQRTRIDCFLFVCFFVSSAIFTQLSSFYSARRRCSILHSAMAQQCSNKINTTSGLPSETEWESAHTHTHTSDEHTRRSRIFPIRNRYEFFVCINGGQRSIGHSHSEWVLYAAVCCGRLLNMPSFACVFFCSFTRLARYSWRDMKHNCIQPHTLELYWRWTAFSLWLACVRVSECVRVSTNELNE